MDIKIGEYYRITFDIGGKLLTYDCKIISIDSQFIKIKDKFSNEYNYNIAKIVSFIHITKKEVEFK